GSSLGSSLDMLVRNFLTPCSSNWTRVYASSTAITEPRPYVGSTTREPTSNRFISLLPPAAPAAATRRLSEIYVARQLELSGSSRPRRPSAGRFLNRSAIH